jgi:hypothetical protein
MVIYIKILKYFLFVSFVEQCNVSKLCEPDSWTFDFIKILAQILNNFFQKFDKTKK